LHGEWYQKFFDSGGGHQGLVDRHSLTNKKNIRLQVILTELLGKINDFLMHLLGTKIADLGQLAVQGRF